MGSVRAYLDDQNRYLEHKYFPKSRLLNLCLYDFRIHAFSTKKKTKQKIEIPDTYFLNICVRKTYKLSRTLQSQKVSFPIIYSYGVWANIEYCDAVIIRYSLALPLASVLLSTDIT